MNIDNSTCNQAEHLLVVEIGIIHRGMWQNHETRYLIFVKELMTQLCLHHSSTISL